MKTGEYRSKPMNRRKGQLSFDLMFAIIMVLFLIQLLAVAIGEINSSSRSFEQMALASTLAYNVADQMNAVDSARYSSTDLVEAKIKVPGTGLYGDYPDFDDFHYELIINGDSYGSVEIVTDTETYMAKSSLGCINIIVGTGRSFSPGDTISIRCSGSTCTCT